MALATSPPPPRPVARASRRLGAQSPRSHGTRIRALISRSQVMETTYDVRRHVGFERGRRGEETE